MSPIKVTGVYRITTKTNGKIYLGISMDIRVRWRKHLSQLRRGAHPNCHLQSAFNLYGESNFVFDVLEECDLEELSAREEHWIAQLHSYDRSVGYNMLMGGRHGRHTEETKKKISEANKGQQPTAYCLQRVKEIGVSQERREALSKLKTGVPMAEETKKKIARSKMGHISTLKGGTLKAEHKSKIKTATQGESNPFFGKTHSEITKQKMHDYWEARGAEVRASYPDCRRCGAKVPTRRAKFCSKSCAAKFNRLGHKK